MCFNAKCMSGGEREDVVMACQVLARVLMEWVKGVFSEEK